MLDLELIEYAEKRIHSKEVLSKEQIVQLLVLSLEAGHGRLWGWQGAGRLRSLQGNLGLSLGGNWVWILFPVL